MTIQELYDISVDSIVNKIQNSHGLNRFAHRRAKYEGWLKVELIDSLVRAGFNALPEIGLIDVSFDSVAIELKTINTNIRYENVINTTRPITKNTNGVVLDIESLRGKNYQDKFVLFVVFPIIHNNKKWQVQLKRITSHLTEHRYRQFYFNNNIPAVIYLGKI